MVTVAAAAADPVTMTQLVTVTETLAQPVTATEVVTVTETVTGTCAAPVSSLSLPDP